MFKLNLIAGVLSLILICNFSCASLTPKTIDKILYSSSSARPEWLDQVWQSNNLFYVSGSSFKVETKQQARDLAIEDTAYKLALEVSRLKSVFKQDLVELFTQLLKEENFSRGVKIEQVYQQRYLRGKEQTLYSTWLLVSFDLDRLDTRRSGSRLLK
jgi:hypothetical protein